MKNINIEPESIYKSPYLNVPKKIVGAIKKACIDYSMIEEGDRIAIGISGGKDSMLLLSALKIYQLFSSSKFEIFAIIIDNGFENTDFTGLYKHLENIRVEYTVIKTRIADELFYKKKVKYPCSLCSRLRKGILVKNALANGCGKIALGHHLDDGIATLFLNMFYEGRINSFEPKSYLSEKGVYLIRPMIYLTEQQIIAAVKTMNLPVFKNKCPVSGKTKREYVNKLIGTLSADIQNFRDSMLSALQNKEQLLIWGKKSDCNLNTD